MDATRFWEIVAASAPGDDGLEEQSERLTAQLAELTDEGLVAFDVQLSNTRARLYSWDHWGAATVMLGGCSDDVFEDFRTWVIAQGREVFERFEADPDSIVDAGLEDEEEIGAAELFGYAAATLYEERTGMEIFDALPDEHVYDDAPPRGERLDDTDREAVQARYPRLHAAYGGRETFLESLGRQFQWPKALRRTDR